MTQENAAQKTEEDLNSPETLASEIDAGVDNIMSDLAAQNEGDGDGLPDKSVVDNNNQDGNAPDDTKTDEIKPEDVKPDDVKSDDVKPDEIKPDETKLDDDKPVPVTDVLLTRAVKAGMSLADARTFQDAEALERNCDLLEVKDKTDDNNLAKKQDDIVVDPLDAIPDLDPEEYDESIVNGFKALKDIVRNQQATIKGLEKKGVESLESSFDAQVDALDGAYAKALGTGKVDPNSPQAKKRGELRDMYDVLKSGYEAKSQNVPPDDIFKQAVGLTLSTEMKEEAVAKKEEILKTRTNQHTVRPGGKKINAKNDAFDEVAQEIDNKYFK